MKYIKNLIIAILGRNPYLEELDKLREQYNKAAQNVEALQDMYYDAIDRWNESDKQAKLLQALVENLRERIREKDEMINKTNSLQQKEEKL